MKVNLHKLPLKVITAIIAITILEALAITHGINGAFLGIAIAAIAGLAGYEIGHLIKPK